MTKLTDKEIKHIAQLSKLELSARETEKFKKQLSSVVNFINQLKKVKTDGIEPTSQTTGLVNVLATDETKTGLSQDEVFLSTANTCGDFFRTEALLKERGGK